MKTAVYINTFAKMVNYDLVALASEHIKPIAIVTEDEFEKFNNAYGRYFTAIYPCKNMPENSIEKISYDFAHDIIAEEIRLGNDVRIICLSEDNLLLAASLRDAFHIRGMKLKETIPFRDKVIMKNVLKEKNIRVPRYCEFDDNLAKDCSTYFQNLKAKIGLPLVAKPLNLLGGLGVVIIDSLSSFSEFCQNKADDLDYQVEEFISGTLFHCDSIRRGSKTLFSVSCEYTNPNFDFQLGKSVISMPLQKDEPITQRITAFNEEVLNALSYEQGASHHELFLSGDELIFLEIAARSPGGLATPTYRRAFNIGFEDVDFKMQMDIPFDISPIYDAHFFSGMFPKITGKVKKLITPKLKSNFEMNWVVNEGHWLDTSKSLRDKSASITAWNSNPQELREDFDILQSFQNLIVV